MSDVAGQRKVPDGGRSRPSRRDAVRTRDATRAERAAQLVAYGLVDGDEVRWHDPGRSGWARGRVHGVGPDGSLSVTSQGGRQRALRPDAVEVLTKTRRGSLTWRAVIGEHQQLALFAEPARPPRPEAASRIAGRQRGSGGLHRNQG